MPSLKITGLIFNGHDCIAYEVDRRGEKLFKGIHEDAGRKNGVKFPTWEENQSIVLLGITIGYE